MSAAKLILGLLGTEVVQSLAVEATTALVTDFLGSHSNPSSANRQCRRCPWKKKARELPAAAGVECLVPGRARIEVPGLRGHPERIAAVESNVLRLRGVYEARANHLTGRLLVLFDPSTVDVPAVRRAIENDQAPVVVHRVREPELVGAGLAN